MLNYASDQKTYIFHTSKKYSCLTRETRFKVAVNIKILHIFWWTVRTLNVGIYKEPLDKCIKAPCAK